MIAKPRLPLGGVEGKYSKYSTKVTVMVPGVEKAAVITLKPKGYGRSVQELATLLLRKVEKCLAALFFSQRIDSTRIFGYA